VGTKALLGFGGDVVTVGDGWRGATAPATRDAFIAAMVALMQARGYDGIDVNWEGLTPADFAQFTAFITELRAALDAITPRPLLTFVPTTGSDDPVPLVAAVRQHLDQINLQTYVMSGPYPGWVTWFNSPIFSGGFTFPSTGGPVPSADAEVDRFAAAGIPVGDLAIGIQFDGAVWAGGTGTTTEGVSQPRQTWSEIDPPPSVEYQRSADIIDFFTPAKGYTKTFDAVARVPWIGRDAAGGDDDRFVSYDDEQAIAEKAAYIAQKGLGGVFVFEVSGDFFPAAVGDARHPLLTAVRNAFLSAPPPPPPSGFTGGLFVAAGRLDGPGTPAQIVTGPGPGRVAEVRAFDVNGAPRLNFQVYPAGFQGGVRVAACDVDGDGRDDIVSVAGPGGAPHVRIMKFDGAGNLVADLASFFAYDLGFVGGLFIACADIDGDGHPDIVLGVDAGGGPHVRILRILGGAISVLDEFFAYDPGFRGGIRVAAGDVDGDGTAELILGAGPGGGPHVRVLKYVGGAWTELVSAMVYDLGFRQGIFVAAGDLTGDGVAEIVTSADAGGGPHVRAVRYDPATPGGLAPVGEFFAYDPAFLGGVRVGAGPFNGPGAGRIVTGAGAGGGAQVGTFSAAGVPGAAFFAY
jgi:hypothetical protein